VSPEPAKGTVGAVLIDLRDEVGTTENPPGSNRTKYGAKYGLDGYAWCAMFVWFILVVLNAIEHIKSAYTPAVFEWYRGLKRTFTDLSEVEPGDLIFFRNSTRICHIGFVRFVRNGVVYTTEGNTSSGSAGSQDDGGGVFNRERTSVSGFWIAGFAKPLYKAAPKKVVLDFPDTKTWFGKTDKGADIKNWQRDLNQYFAGKGFEKPFDFKGSDKDILGTFEGKTLKFTKQFQHEQALDVDGRVGQHTIDRMEKILKRRED
jgi:hypothetical protein